MSRSEAASLGGRARAKKTPPEKLSEIGRAGAHVTANKSPSEKRRAHLQANVTKIVDAAPELSADQVARLRAILAPVSQRAVRRET